MKIIKLDKNINQLELHPVGNYRTNVLFRKFGQVHNQIIMTQCNNLFTKQIYKMDMILFSLKV
jgi:hypothetical protein